MKRVWMIAVPALAVAALATTPAIGATGGNSDNAKLCQKEGWRTVSRGDGSTFANQGDCVSYGAKGNTIVTAPSNAWRSACEQSGGNFGVANTDINGNPLTPPAYAYVCGPVSETFWNNVLTFICFSYPDVVVAEFTYQGSIGTGNCIRSGST